jgi:outer membrane protein assembly factor BamD (BamD/ComL family)
MIRRPGSRHGGACAWAAFLAALLAWGTPLSEAVAQSPDAGDAPAPLAEEQETGARDRCDRADTLLRTGKYQDAAALVAPFLKDPVLVRSRHRDQGRYLYGAAAFAQEDYVTAGRVLSDLAPFSDPAFGAHACYLLARVHDIADEADEALPLFDEVLPAWERRVASAKAALASPEALKDRPDELARLQTVVQGDPPQYVLRAPLQAAWLLFEQGRYSDAHRRYEDFARRFPASPHLNEVRLRVGCCLVRLKQHPPALQMLTGLVEDSRFGEQAQWWMARAFMDKEVAANAEPYEKRAARAADHLQKAVASNAAMISTDAQARARRPEMQMELAAAWETAGEYRQAAAAYQALIDEKLDPVRVEAARQRQITTYGLAGMFAESEAAAKVFERTYPRSPLLAEVLYRRGENARLQAEAAANDPGTAGSAEKAAALGKEAADWYERTLSRFPEFASANQARFGLASARYRAGQYEEAIAVLSAIPAADRVGPLADVPLLLADCLVRSAPEQADDALSAGRLLKHMNDASRLLEGFVASQSKDQRVPEAMLQFGHCQQRIASVLAQPQERSAALQRARQAYDRVLQQYPNHAAMPEAIFQRANCYAVAGDWGGAMNELGRFQGDPLRHTAVAPKAAGQLAAILISQNRHGDAVNVLTNFRNANEAAMLADKNRAQFVPRLQLQHGVALQQAGKPAEAADVFDRVVKNFSGRGEAAEASWRGAQCRRQEIHERLRAARVVLQRSDAPPQEQAAAKAAFQESLAALRQAAAALEPQVAASARSEPGGEAHLRALYETASCYRALAEVEIELARMALADEARRKLEDAAAARVKPGEQPLKVYAPRIPLSAVPPQPAEKLARDRYSALIAARSEAPLALVGRLELAEMRLARGQSGPAAQALQEALLFDPPRELAGRIQVRLGDAFLAGNEAAAAAAAFAPVVASGELMLAAEARRGLGETLLAESNWGAAIEQLLQFRQNQALRTIPEISDRGMVRLGQAYARSGQWAASRDALESMLRRFPQGPWSDQARFEIGWAYQNENQLDAAISYYRQAAPAGGETGAKAQLHVGLCLANQKKFAEAAAAFMSVAAQYDEPALAAQALCEAGRAHVELKMPEEARAALNRVLQEYAGTPWAETAKKQLAEIQ